MRFVTTRTHMFKNISPSWEFNFRNLNSKFSIKLLPKQLFDKLWWVDRISNLIRAILQVIQGVTHSRKPFIYPFNSGQTFLICRNTKIFRQILIWLNRCVANNLK